VITVSGLRKDFKRLTAVHDMSFTVGDGEIFGLLGPNGAGKTTTVRMLAGLIAPTVGEATVNGHTLRDGSQKIRAITGILTESPGLHDKLTARQNLAYYARLYGLRGQVPGRGRDERARGSSGRGVQQGDAPEDRHRPRPAPRTGGHLS
jgi:ABC-type multidrug transport system ATPase subunit